MMRQLNSCTKHAPRSMRLSSGLKELALTATMTTLGFSIALDPSSLQTDHVDVGGSVRMMQATISCLRKANGYSYCFRHMLLVHFAVTFDLVHSDQGCTLHKLQPS